MAKPESISLRVDGSVESGFTVHFFRGSDTERDHGDFVATVAGPADGSELLKAIRDPRRVGAPGAPPVPIPVAARSTGALSTATAFGPSPMESPTGVRLDNLVYRAPEVAAAVDAVILAHGRDGLSRLIGDRHLTPVPPHSATTLLSSLPNLPGCPSVIVPAAPAANPADPDNNTPRAIAPVAASPTLGVRRRLRHSVTYWEDAMANANAAVVAIGHAAATFYTTLNVTTDPQELYPPTTGGSTTVSKSTPVHLEQQPVQQALCKYHLACAACPPLLTTPPTSSGTARDNAANVPAAADAGDEAPDHEPQQAAPDVKAVVVVPAVPATVRSALETLKYRAGTVWRNHERLVRVAFAAAGARDLAARFLQRMTQHEAEWAAANSGPAADAAADAKMATVFQQDEAAAAVFDAAFDAATGASMTDALVAAVGTEAGAAFGADYIFASLTPERFAAASLGGGASVTA